MRKLWLVARKELRMTATRSYFIATAIGPFVMYALVALPTLLQRDVLASSVEGRTVAVVAAESPLPAIRSELAQLGVIVEEATEESGLADRVLAGELDGYVVVPADAPGAEEARYVTDNPIGIVLRVQVSRAIGRAVVRRRLEQAGMDAERISRLTQLPRVRGLVLYRGDMVEQDYYDVLLWELALIGLLYGMLQVYGSALGRAVLKEKTDRTVEVMLSSLRPFALLAGKVVGKGLAGLLQYLTWMIVTLVAVEILGARLGVVSVPPFVQPGNLMALLAFLVLGFLLYSCPYAIAGAAAAAEEDYAQLVLPAFALQTVSALCALVILASPDGPLAVTLSLIPITAPIVMFIRVLIGDPGAVQIAVAVTGVVLCTVAAVWAAGKAFRLGILLAGNRTTFREVIRLLRT